MTANDKSPRTEGLVALIVEPSVKLRFTFDAAGKKKKKKKLI